MAITPFSGATPVRGDRTTFSSRVDAFITWLIAAVAEFNSTAAAMNLNSTNDTSATSNAIGTGAKTFAVSAGKSFQPGMFLIIADTAAPSTNLMVGTVTSYSGTSLVMNITAVMGSGTLTAWTISQSAPQGSDFTASIINAATDKTSPVNNDLLGIVDSAAANVLKKLTFANLLTWISNNMTAMANALVSSAAGWIGYNIGAGGTVTQATSKTTGVTLNKPVGTITTHNAALAAGAVATFTFTNSSIAATDIILVTIYRGGIAASANYNVWADAGAGSSFVNLKNISGGSLSEAVTLNFAIIKGATS